MDWPRIHPATVATGLRVVGEVFIFSWDQEFKIEEKKSHYRKKKFGREITTMTCQDNALLIPKKEKGCPGEGPSKFPWGAMVQKAGLLFPLRREKRHRTPQGEEGLLGERNTTLKNHRTKKKGGG